MRRPRLRRPFVERLQVTVDHLISARSTFRGSARADGRITLLTVDFELTDHVLRLAESFRRHVDPDGPVVVVQNGRRSDNRRLREAGLRVVGWGHNLGHGRALDYGLRTVTTEYVLVCDPDAVIVSERFRAEVMPRLKQYGVCGIVISDSPEHQRYHPICTAFATRLWKDSPWSMEEDWPAGYDVGGALTRFLGGLEPGAVLPLTRGGNNGAVWAEAFSNTYGASRIRALDDDDVMDGTPVAAVRRYHQRWAAWADRLAAGTATVEEFPEPE